MDSFRLLTRRAFLFLTSAFAASCAGMDSLTPTSPSSATSAGRGSGSSSPALLETPSGQPANGGVVNNADSDAYTDEDSDDKDSDRDSDDRDSDDDDDRDSDDDDRDSDNRDSD